MGEEAINYDAFFEGAKRRWEEEVNLNTIVRHYLDIENVIQQYKSEGSDQNLPLGSVDPQIIDDFIDDFMLAMDAWSNVDGNYLLNILKQIYQYPSHAFENNQFHDLVMEQITDDPIPANTPLVALLIANERYLNFIRIKYSNNFSAFHLVPISEINYLLSDPKLNPHKSW